VLALVITGVYGLLFAIAVGNAWLMPRLRRQLIPSAPGDPGPVIAVLIPARDEAENLADLLPRITGGRHPVLVFDDESSDGTAEIARRLGATVVAPREPLPDGWTGKNRACHELALAASEAVETRWWLFLDADVRPEPGFLDALSALAARDGARWPVLTGFARMRPGSGLEPAYLSWVPWILLATNPFGLVAQTGLSHNRFTNGQVCLWRQDIYSDLWPNQMVKSQILEDVLMGRLLARHGVRVRVLNLSDGLGVQMYRTLREAWDGMTKNSVEIAGPGVGTVLLSGFLSLLALGWLATGPWMPMALGSLLLSKVAVDRVVRMPVWTVPLLPLSLLAASATLLYSAFRRSRGKTVWKGRTYG